MELRDYKLLIIEMATKEWNDIVEGVRKVHTGLKDWSDVQIEVYLKDVTLAHFLHAYVDFVDEHLENKE